MTGDTAADAQHDDDFHRRFREALDRKNKTTHADNGPHVAEEKVHETKDLKVKREFRRKSV